MRRTLCAVLALASCAAEAQIYTRTNGNGVVEATNVPDSGFRLTYPGKGTLIHSRSFRGIYNGEYDHHVLAAANTWGVSPVLVRAVIQAESAFDRNAVSSAPQRRFRSRNTSRRRSNRRNTSWFQGKNENWWNAART